MQDACGQLARPWGNPRNCGKRPPVSTYLASERAGLLECMHSVLGWAYVSGVGGGRDRTLEVVSARRREKVAEVGGRRLTPRSEPPSKGDGRVAGGLASRCYRESGCAGERNGVGSLKAWRQSHASGKASRRGIVDGRYSGSLAIIALHGAVVKAV